MDIHGITTIANSSVLPEQRPKASTGSPNSVSGNRSSNREAPPISLGSGEAEDGAHKEALKKVVENTNKLMEISNIHLDYSIDESTQRVVVKVINGNTDVTRPACIGL